VTASTGLVATVLREAMTVKALQFEPWGSVMTGTAARPGRNLGEDLPRTSPCWPARPPHTKALTCTNGVMGMPGSCPDLIRDEEVVGSNPATPTARHQVRPGAERSAPGLICFAGPFGVPFECQLGVIFGIRLPVAPSEQRSLHL